MSSYISFLITVLYGDELIHCALKLKRDSLPRDCEDFPMEPENRAFLHSKLPLHVRNCGPIVEVKDLFEVEVVN